MSLARNGTEATIYILPGGETEFRLDDVQSGRYLEDVSGLGMPGASHVTRRGCGQDGETWLATRLNPRVISLSVVQVYPDRAAMWAGHRDWFAAFAPGDDAGTLRKVLPDGRKFDLPVRFQGGMDAGSTERFGARVQTYALQLVAHDPIWRGADEHRLSAQAYAGDQLVLPFELPFWLDGTTVLGQFAVDYAGTWRAWPQVVLEGPMTNPLVEHVERGVEMQLTGSISTGCTVTFAPDPGEPAVTNQDGVDLSGRLAETADLAGFYLVRGTNTINVRAEGLSEHSAAALRYHEQFIGV